MASTTLTLRERIELTQERKARKALARALRNRHHPYHAIALATRARFGVADGTTPASGLLLLEKGAR